MNVDFETLKQKTQDTYNTAWDFFDDPANSYWDRYGRRTVEHLNLEPGFSVLDVACGAGASALPAASRVGPTGRVLGVDLAKNLLDLARKKAQRAGLENVTFREGDMTQLHFPDHSFDAIICVFGVFFVSDMEGLVAKLWRMLKPGGQLAISTWGTDFFEPMYPLFFEAVHKVRPDLVTSFRPWERVANVAAVRRLLREGGTANIVVDAESGEHSLQTKDSWWKMVLGSGLRATVEAMGPEFAEQVRKENLAHIEANRVRSVLTNVIYGLAQKSRSDNGRIIIPTTQ